MSAVVGGLATGLPGGHRTTGQGGGLRRGYAAAAAVVYIRGEGK